MNLKRITFWVFIISFIIILFTVIAYVINGFLNPSYILSTEKLGHFGDFVGGFVGVILTFLATVLIYLTYKSQTKELEQSRELFAKQSFENTFFNMLKVHQDLRKEISFDFFEKRIMHNTNEDQKVKDYRLIYDYSTKISGKAFFDFAQKDFTKLFSISDKPPSRYTASAEIMKKHKDKGYNPFADKHNYLEGIKFKYNIFWETYANYLGDYFRNIYHILKFISDEKKKKLKILMKKMMKIGLVKNTKGMQIYYNHN